MNKDNLSMVEKVGVLVSNVDNFFNFSKSFIKNIEDCSLIDGFKIRVLNDNYYYTQDEFEDLLKINEYITDGELERIHNPQPCYFIRNNVLFEDGEPEHTIEITKKQYDYMRELLIETRDLLLEIVNYYNDFDDDEYTGLSLSISKNIHEQIDELYNVSDKYRREYDNYLLKEKLGRELVEKTSNQKKLNKI